MLTAPTREEQLDSVALLLLLATGGALYTVLRPLVIYPCRLREWQHAFRAAYRADREGLRSARRHRRQVLRKSGQALSAFDRRVAKIDSDCRAHVHTLEGERQRLLHPGRGVRVEGVDGLGQLELYEHSLVFIGKVSGAQEAGPAKDSADDIDVPLAGLTVRTQPGHGHLWIEVKRPSGPDGRRRKDSVEFPLTQERQVRKLADEIHNEAQAENARRQDREREADEKLDEIRRVQHEAAAQKAQVQCERAELAEAQAPDIEEAEAALDEQCDDWEKLTGRRPPSWWRW